MKLHLYAWDFCNNVELNDERLAEVETEEAAKKCQLEADEDRKSQLNSVVLQHLPTFPLQRQRP
jgi:hypothetical protein